MGYFPIHEENVQWKDPSCRGQRVFREGRHGFVLRPTRILLLIEGRGLEQSLLVGRDLCKRSMRYGWGEEGVNSSCRWRDVIKAKYGDCVDVEDEVMQVELVYSLDEKVVSGLLVSGPFHFPAVLGLP
jgi:hypothetical protein